jgi:aminopeptidase N
MLRQDIGLKPVWGGESASGQEAWMSTSTFKFDERTERMIEQLKVSFNAPTKAEVMRKALALLELARQAKESNQSLAIVDKGTSVKGIQQILIP